MRTVGLFEAKQKLSELVERAREGERIGITRRGKLAALIVPRVRNSTWKRCSTRLKEFEKVPNRTEASPRRT
jgi:prevent-host-death family protein